MKNLDPDSPRRIIACRGDSEPLIERVGSGITLLADIEVYSRLTAEGPPVTRELKAGSDEATNAHRLELIEQVRAGKAIELAVKRARVYRQGKNPGTAVNRRGLRFNTEALAAIAPTWKGKPFLVDHNTYEQGARKGTILSSEAGDHNGMPAIYMGFSVVKPDAVISVLDGTIDVFSIGWFPSSSVLCTLHGKEMRGMGWDRCCWPLDAVEVDGKRKIAEYEYQADAEGKELSSVNVPAVSKTKIEEYHAALAAELSLPTPTRIKEHKMAWIRLAAALGLTALNEADEGAAVDAVTALRTRLASAEQQLGTATADLTAARAQLTAAQAGIAAAGRVRLDGLIQDGIRVGKLQVVRGEDGQPRASAAETRLRRIGAEANGLAQVEAELAEMPVIVPVGKRPVAATAGEERKQPLALAGADAQLDAELENVAAQLGLKVEDMRAFQGLYSEEV